MTSIMWALGLAIAFNLPIYFMTRKKQLLTTDGIFLAAVLGIFLFTITPFAWFVLIAFFLSSSALSKFKSTKKKTFHEKFAKGSQRDAGQVWANGGLPSLLLLGYWIQSSMNPLSFLQLTELNVLSPWIIGYVIAVAAVNADTFATELGTLSKNPPRNILKPWKKVVPGTSGGISVLGTLASLLGAMEISCLYFLFLILFNTSLIQNNLIHVMFIVILTTLLGFTGSLIDSVLGATIQEMYWCEQCGTETEQAFHVKCSQPTKKMRGITKFNNDVVNFVSALIASILGMMVVIIAW